MTHDRIHAKRPHDAERFRTGRIVEMAERDGHCVVTVEPDGGESGGERDESDGESDESRAERDGTNADDRSSDEEDGATAADTDRVELVVTFAVRDLFVSRLEIGPEESPVGEQVWFREYGG
ncbi:MAG: hypothetical protein ABEI75_01470, partial [Halobaculum sp.]